MFAYEPMTEEEALRERYQPLSPGQYQAVIRKAIHKQSAAGNPMIEVELDVYSEDGRAHFVRDYIVFTRNMMWKAIHCADSAGVIDRYQAGNLDADTLVNQNVSVDLDVQIGNKIPYEKLMGKPSGSRYPDKNTVKDYIKRSDQAPKASYAKPVDQVQDDDIPF